MVRNGGLGTSLVVQGLRLCASTAGGGGLIPGPATKIPHAMQSGQKKKKKNEGLIYIYTHAHIYMCIYVHIYQNSKGMYWTC